MVIEHKITKKIDIDIEYVSKMVEECALETISDYLDDFYNINVKDLDKQTYCIIVAEILNKVTSIWSKNS